MKFYLLLLQINRGFDFLIDIFASQTNISANCLSIVYAPDPSILVICQVYWCVRVIYLIGNNKFGTTWVQIILEKHIGDLWI